MVKIYYIYGEPDYYIYLLVLHLRMIITFMGDTDCVFSEILWNSCFDCSITLKFR